MNDYDIKKLYEDMEMYLIQSMKRNLDRHLTEESEVGFQFLQWQAEKLKELKRYQRENQKIIGRYTLGLDKEISEHLQNELKEGSKKAIEQYNKITGSNLKPNKVMNRSFFKTNDRKVNNLIKVVNNDLKTANTSALRMVNDQYRQIIHKSAFFVGNGVFTEQQAIRMSVDEISQKKLTTLAVDEASKNFLAGGLNCIEYSDGRRVNIASYSQMAIRTASLRSQLMGEGDFRASIGRTLVKVTTHGGACKLCTGWQGKVLIDDVYSGGKSDGKHTLLSKAMNQGFLHPNCRHGITTYYPELEEDEEVEEPVQENDNQIVNTIKATIKQEATQQALNYAIRNVKRYRRLEKGSLDRSNITKYRVKKNKWTNEVEQLDNQLQSKTYKKLTEQEIDNFQNSSNITYNKFTKSNKEAMDEYTMGGYLDVNDYLNGKFDGFDSIDDFINDIDDAISKYNLEENVVTYRGTSKKYYNSLKIGDEFTTKMYGSTSLNKNIAKTFIEGKEEPLMLEILVPKGTPCIYIGDNSAYEFEAELLLKRDLKYKVVDIKEDKMIVEVVE